MRISTSFLFAAFLASRCLAFPLSFEKRDATHFVARLPEGTAELGPDHVMLRDVTLRFLGSAPTSRLEGLGSPAPSTYFRAGLVRTFPQFPRLAIHGLYPGVDAIFYGSGENLEYDLQVSAGGALDKIRISVEGAHDLLIDDQGNLVMHSPSGILQQMRPRVFQAGREISARYQLLSEHEVGLRLGKHDPRAPLTIDPVLSYVKTFGGSAFNSATVVATDAQGNIYAAGQTDSVDFPTTSNSVYPSSDPALRVLSNAGQTITPLRAGTAYSVGVVGASQNGSVLYAGTSQGILLSGDGGATWRPTSPLTAFSTTNNSPNITVNAFSVDAFDPATILVATNIGLFGTDSGGEYWGTRDTGLNVSASGYPSVVSVMYNPTNPYIAYAVSSGPSYLFASSDAGNTWQRLNPTYPGEPPAPQFSFSPNMAATLSTDGTVLYVINGNGTLLKSPDGGMSWVKLAQGFFTPLSMQFDPTNASTLYVLDDLGLHKSTDGGVTFITVGSTLGIKTLAVDSSGAVYVGNQSPNLFVSTNGAGTFTQVPNLTAVQGATLSVTGNKVYLGTFTPTTPYVIKFDPTGTNILYSTFLGGSFFADLINGLAVDFQGNAVVVGTATSPDFPFTTPPSSPPLPTSGKSDGFLTKLSSDGTRLIYSTALGASKQVSIQALALDPSGAVFITGASYSSDFPTTPNVYQPALPTTACPIPQTVLFGPPIPAGNAFVSKVAADGKTLIYSTFLTGSCGSYTSSIATDTAGDVIVAGITGSPDFPVSANSYQATFPGGVNQSGLPNISDAGFVSKLSPAGDKLLASTFLGGGYSTQANSVTLDASGNTYVTGFTQGLAKGATPGAYQTALMDKCTPTLSIGPGVQYTGTGDAYVLKLDPTLSTPAFLTYLGGSCSDSGSTIALDTTGDIWISGTTSSPDFPLNDPFQATQISSDTNPGFVSELSADGSKLLFSSFSGGPAMALAPGAVYVAGTSGTSAFIDKIDPTTTSSITVNSVAPVIGFPPAFIEPFLDGVAPGQLIQINGANLGPATKAPAQLDATGRLPFILANTVVLFDNIPAPLISVQASAIQCFVPFEVVSTTKITVVSNGQTSNAVKTGILGTAPQILSILNADGTANSATHPAKLGSVIALYLSGLGQTTPPSDDGLVNAPPLTSLLVPVTVYFTGSQSGIAPQYAGAAPGLIAGITQVNVQVPTTALSSGTGAISVSVGAANASLYTSQ